MASPPRVDDHIDSGHHRVVDCEHCGATLEDGLYCRYCGRARHVEGPRLLEALSIETDGDEASPIIPYGARLPVSYADVFSTAEDGQRAFELHLVMGNAKRASACRTLARIAHPLEHPGPRGGPRIDVTVTIEPSGALTVEARERGAAGVYRREGLRIATTHALG